MSPEEITNWLREQTRTGQLIDNTTPGVLGRRFGERSLKYMAAADLIEKLTTERDALAETVRGMREALEEWRKLAAHRGYSTASHRARTDSALALTPTEAEMRARRNAEAYEILTRLLRVEPETQEEFDLVKRGSQLTGPEVWPEDTKAEKRAKENAALRSAVEDYLVVNWDELPSLDGSKDAQKEWVRVIADAVARRKHEELDPLISRNAEAWELLEWASKYMNTHNVDVFPFFGPVSQDPECEFAWFRYDRKGPAYETAFDALRAAKAGEMGKRNAESAERM